MSAEQPPTERPSIASLDRDVLEEIVSSYYRSHAMIPCAGCSGTVRKADAYRCVDCDQHYHRHCLRQHCAGELEQARSELQRLRSSGGASAELYVCACNEVYPGEPHHPECPARRQYEASMRCAPEPSAELDAYRRTAPLCDKHQPNGGTRGSCLVCACEELSGALSMIDYLCGEPNEMQVSGYDLHCDPQLVVKAVRERLSPEPAGKATIGKCVNKRCGGEDLVTFAVPDSSDFELKQVYRITPTKDDVHGA